MDWFKRISDCIELMTISERRQLRSFTDSGQLIDLIDTIDAEEAKDAKASVYEGDEG